MAYAARPDDPYMVDVEVRPGVVIPMPRSIAEQAGHQERTSLFNPQRGALAFGDTPERDDGAQGSGAVGNVPDNSPLAENAPPMPAPPRDVGSGGSGGRGSEDGDKGRQGTDSQGAGAPTPTAPAGPATKEPRVKTGEVPDPDAAAMAARQRGGRSPGRIVRLSKGGDIRASFIRQPGQDVPEDVSNLVRGDNYSEGAQQRAEAAGMSPEDVFLSQSAGTLPEDTHDATSAQIALKSQEAIEARQKNIRAEQEAIRQQELQRVQIDKAIRARQKLIQDRDAETNKLTPQSAKEVWASKSTFQQIGAAISIALGGYLQGLQGRDKNPGLQMVNESIMQEVADQRARYDAAVAKGEQARGDYAEAVALYGTPEAAALDLTNRRLEAAAKLTEAQAAGIGTLEYKQAAALQSQELRQQKAENLLKLHQLENGRIVQENWQYAPPQYAQIGGPLKPEARQRIVRYRGNTYFIPSQGETRIKALSESLSGLEHLDGELARLEALTADASKLSPQALDEVKQKINAAKQNIGATANMLLGQGAMSKDEIEMIDKRLGTADDLIRAETGLPRIQETRGFFRRKADVMLRNNVTLDPEGTEFLGGGDQGFEVDTGGQ